MAIAIASTVIASPLPDKEIHLEITITVGTESRHVHSSSIGHGGKFKSDIVHTQDSDDKTPVISDSDNSGATSFRINGDFQMTCSSGGSK